MFKGKKSYLTAGAAILTAVGLYLGGEADLTVTIQSCFTALLVIFLRKGVKSAENAAS